MTTTVIVKAHCSANKEVHAAITDTASGSVIEEIVLQDGESAERVVFDDRVITVREVLK